MSSYQETDTSVAVLGTFHFESITSNLIMAEEETNQESDSHHSLTECEHKDGSFRVLKTVSLDPESENGEDGKDEADDGPDTNPVCHELLITFCQSR